MKQLLAAATAVSTGTAASFIGGGSIQATGTTSSGTGAADIAIEVSNDNEAWLTLCTMSLVLGTAATTDGFSSNGGWSNVRARVTAISGTGASVNVTMEG